ncbi:MAG: 3-deoxy-manno-octulosonate cytidylyltransferase [Bacteroidaceae bacterium]|nr:3-deoxy-manno-octulosonate cytidylyltransferase [Bacteroidaceae bacterium]
MKFAAIIPARYASTRFPGKPLAMLGGKPIIQRVYERVSSCVAETYVATDDERIYNTVEKFGGKAIMTRTDHKSGTDRCWEAVSKLGAERFDVIINVQGDEPFIHTQQIEALRDCFNAPATQIATLVKPFGHDAPIEAVENPNSPKVVVSPDGRALYFSRSIIPYLRNRDKAEWMKHHTYYKHIGIYAYRTTVLKEITMLQPSPLELAESLEQLRWLENGYQIQVGITDIETIGIDTPEDLARAEKELNKEK